MLALESERGISLKDIRTLSSGEENMKISEKRCVVLDMDGTVYLGSIPITGAVDFIKKYWDKLDFYFLSNNTSKSPDTYVKRLNSMGIPATLDLILSPTTPLVDFLKENGIHTAVDTAGHIPFQSFEKILPYTDLFLYDVKCYDSDKHRQYTGASNELILSNLGRLLKMGIAIWVRIPIIPTVNDSEEEMLNIKKFIISCGSPEKIELLPYHAMGEHKYAAIGKQVQTFSVPSKEKISQLKRVFV